MPTSSFTKFEAFTQHLAEKVHDFRAAGDVLKILLALSAPSASLDALKADLTDELGTANGYTAGGTDTQNGVSRAGGVTSVTGVDVTFTASGGSIGPFRYVVLYNDTSASPLKPLIGYWDYGSNLTLVDGEALLVDFGASMFTIT